MHAGFRPLVCSFGIIIFQSDWNNFFRDASDMDETKPGERPDTVHIQNLPCKFFNIGDSIRPSEGL